jgi:Flp pilus assembly protein TadG
MLLERLRSKRHRDSGTVAVGAAVGVRERGAEAVEFALVVPVFLLLVFGVVDFGYMINHDTMINNASREGARLGALTPVANDIECTVRQSLSTVETPVVKVAAPPNYCRPSPTLITVTVDCLKPDDSACVTFAADAKSGGTVIVKVDYTHSWITPVGSTIRPGGMVLSKTTKMRIE